MPGVFELHLVDWRRHVTEQGPPRGPKQQELEAINAIFQILNSLDQEDQQKVLQTVSAYYQSGTYVPPRTAGRSPEPSVIGPFSEDRSMTPKTFILQKQPTTDVERIACLAYYLTHYRDMPQFKTLDLSMLNTEAAQPKFANAADSSNNAVKRGYLVQAAKDNKMLSAAGEVFVQKLPDKEAARAAMSNVKPRRKNRKATQREESAESGGDV
jgi:hypothetical protein